MIGNENFGINEAGMQTLIPMFDKLATGMNLSVIDMHAALAGHPEFIPDRVHPNNAGATAMARAAYRALTGKEFQTGHPPAAVAVPAAAPAK